MNQQNITLISFGYCEKVSLEKISEAVSIEFPFPVKIREAHIDLSDFYDSSRRQYNGNKLLREVDSMVFPGALKTIGLFGVDLYIPILTYIFGQAVLGGKTGIASLFRLNNERYGLPFDKSLMVERFTKEVIHELGHTFGLIHCHVPTCVMRSSTYVEDIDMKKTGLCMNCHQRLNELNAHQ